MADSIDFDNDLIRDFFLEFNDAYDSVESNLIQLESSPSDKALLNELFRSVHSIKGNLRMVGCKRVSEFTHVMENLLDAIRHEKLTYSSMLSDVILLSMDRIKQNSQCFFQGIDLDADLPAIEKALQSVVNAKADKYLENVQNLLHLLNPEDEVELEKAKLADKSAEDKLAEDAPAEHAPAEDATTVDTQSAESDTTQCAETKAELPKQDQAIPDQAIPEWDTRQHKDIEFFSGLIGRLELNLPFWHGRSERILRLTEAMLQESNVQLDKIQLEMAIYLHDIGMAFLPSEILTKKESLTDAEFFNMQEHCRLGAELIGRVSGWEEASQIVLQHHEKYNGAGYPQRLKEDAICHGAKMLAIADTYDAMTHERAQRGHKRPVMRAIIEINTCSGSQFDPKWVVIFNNIIRKLAKKKVC